MVLTKSIGSRREQEVGQNAGSNMAGLHLQEPMECCIVAVAGLHLQRPMEGC